MSLSLVNEYDAWDARRWNPPLLLQSHINIWWKTWWPIGSLRRPHSTVCTLLEKPHSWRLFMRCNHAEEHFLFLTMTSSLLVSVRKYANAPTSTIPDAEDSLSLAPTVAPPLPTSLLLQPHISLAVIVCRSISLLFSPSHPPLAIFFLHSQLFFTSPGWCTMETAGDWTGGEKGEGLGHLSSVAVFGEGRMCGKGVGGSTRSRQSSESCGETVFCGSPLPAALTLLAAEITLIAF